MAFVNFLPKLSAYGRLSYDNPSFLKFGSCCHLKWALDPLLLCLPLQPIIQNKISNSGGYLDGITMEEDVKDVAGDTAV